MSIDDILNNLESNIFDRGLTLNHYEQLLQTTLNVRRMIRIECTDIDKTVNLKRLEEIREDFKDIIIKKKDEQQTFDNVSIKHGIMTSPDIKEEINEWSRGLLKEEIHPLTGFSLKQLVFIFDEMVKAEYLGASQKQIFIYMFQGKLKPESKSLEWKVKKSLIRYFFKQMTGRDDIEPKEINSYITDVIDSHDTHTGSSHHQIRDIFKNAKELK